MMQQTEAKRISAYELNHEILPNIDVSKYETLGALLKDIGVTDSENYTWYGKRSELDGGVSLVEGASLQNIKQLYCLSRDIGG